MIYLQWWTIPDSKVHGANVGPVGPRWAQYWPHEPCYQGYSTTSLSFTIIVYLWSEHRLVRSDYEKILVWNTWVSEWVSEWASERVSERASERANKHYFLSTRMSKNKSNTPAHQFNCILYFVCFIKMHSYNNSTLLMSHAPINLHHVLDHAISPALMSDMIDNQLDIINNPCHWLIHTLLIVGQYLLSAST